VPRMAGDRLSLALAPETREVGLEGTPEHTEGYSTPLAETPQAHTPSPSRKSRKSARPQELEPPPLPPPTSSKSPGWEPAAVAPPEDGTSG
jgi:hypothetical protein